MAKKSTDAKDGGRFRDLAVNRRAWHDYEILERMEAGISLVGSEIKSAREGKVNIQEAYVRPEKGEMWLQGAHIAPYDAASYMGHEPRRARRLLLHKSQIRDLAEEVERKGMTLIPLRVYLKDGRAKVEVAVGRGRKSYDKREAIAKRDADREVQRALRQRTRDS